MNDLEQFKSMFYTIGIEYEETTLVNGNTELDINDEHMAHGCELSIQFEPDGKFKMFVTG